MFEIIALLCLAGAVILLIALSIIDLKHWILPDELNLALAVTGVLFHIMTAYHYVTWQSMFAGAAAGAGLLYTIRFFANRYYGRDTLGLGDVKLLGAAGLWLGLDGTLEAVTVGAFAGLVHGLAVAAYKTIKEKKPFSIQNLSIPAGPGFAAGIVFAGAHVFAPYVESMIHAYLAA